LWLARGRLPPVQPRLGASVFKMTEVSRHRSLDTLRGYVRRVDLFKEHAGRRSCELPMHAVHC